MVSAIKNMKVGDEYVYDGWFSLKAVEPDNSKIYPARYVHQMEFTAEIKDETYNKLPWYCEVSYNDQSGNLRSYRLCGSSKHIALLNSPSTATFAFKVVDGKLALSSGTVRFTDETRAKELNANLKIFFEDSEEPIYVNREFISVYSTVFRAMFEGEFKEKNAEEVTIKDMKKEDFLAFLDSLYQPATPIEDETLQGILLVADRYDCKIAMAMCKDFMMKKSLGNFEEYKLYIELAQRYKLIDVHSKTLRVAHRNYLVLMLDPEWLLGLEPETTKSILTFAKENLF